MTCLHLLQAPLALAGLNHCAIEQQRQGGAAVLAAVGAVGQSTEGDWGVELSRRVVLPLGPAAALCAVACWATD